MSREGGELSSPSYRAELIEVVRELATGDLQPSQTPVGSAFVENFNVFEDGDIDNGASQYIGAFLRNEGEAAALTELWPLLLAVLREGGRGTDDEAYRASPSWAALQSAAKRAFEVLTTG